jgi:hypothetical protein
LRIVRKQEQQDPARDLGLFIEVTYRNYDMFCVNKKKSLTGKVCLHKVCSTVLFRLRTEDPHDSPAISLRITLLFFLVSFFVESTVVPKHAVKAYGGSGGTVSLINLANTRETRPGGPQNQSGGFEKEKNP